MRLSVVIPTYNRPEDLRQLLVSLDASTVLPDEIIVVDDYQAEDVLASLRFEFKNVTFHQLREKGFITGARNTGWRKSQGKFVFFVDDDNVVDSDCLKLCLGAAERAPQAGVVGAKTLYHVEPERVMLAGVNYGSLALARTTLIGLNDTDGPRYETCVEVHTAPNAFLVRREVLEQTGGFDESIVQTWSEADFNARVRQAGYKVILEGRARVWHRGPVAVLGKLSSRHVGGSPFRMYYLIRNRYVFVGRYGAWWEQLVFGIVFSNLFLLYYALSMLRLWRWDLIRAALAGAWDGLRYLVTGNLHQRKLAQ